MGFGNSKHSRSPSSAPGVQSPGSAERGKELTRHSLLTAKKHRLLDFPFLQQKISSDGVRSVLEELSEARTADPDNQDVEQLGLTLQLAQDALKCDPQQLPSQLLSRITAPTEGLLPLLEQCRAAQDLFLLSSQPLVLSPGGPLIHTVSEHSALVTGLTLTADGQYAVTCSDNGEVLVTDVRRGCCVRRMSQVAKCPVRALLCCNDTLIVTTARDCVTAHRFETGEEVWRLEGRELTLYPPGLCFDGENQETMLLFDKNNVRLYETATATKLHCLTLPRADNIHFHGEGSKVCARSGYAVASDSNCYMLTSVNLSSRTAVSEDMEAPEVEETFFSEKVQALTMAEGEEAGKPLAIYTTDDIDSADIFFVDATTLDILKIYKGDEPCYGNSFRLTTDQQYLYFGRTTGGVSLWDLQNARECTILPDAKLVEDVVMVDMKRFVTINGDRNVRVWDTTSQGCTQPSALQFQDRTIARMEDWEQVVVREGPEEKEKKTEISVWGCYETASPRYVIVCGEQDCNGFLQLFDVSTSTVVRQIDLGEEVGVTHLRGFRVVLTVGRRLRVLDMQRMEVVTEFTGEVCDRGFSPEPIKEGQEILAPSKTGHHVKVYDSASGKVKAIIKQNRVIPRDRMKRLEDIVVSQDGSVAVAETQIFYVVFHLAKGIALRRLDCEKLGVGYANHLCDYSRLTSDGRYFVLPGRYRLGKGEDEEDSEGVSCIMIYDVQDDKRVRRMLDMPTVPTVLKYEEGYKDFDVSELHLLDDTTILASYKDFILRVYDLQSGKLLHRLEGHSGVAALEVREDSPVFLSYGYEARDRSVRLWRKADFTPLASFTLDCGLQTAMLLPGHSQVFLVVPEDSPTPAVFTVHGQNQQALPGHTAAPPLASYPQLFEGIKLDSVLAPLPSDLAALDADDPDQGSGRDVEDDIARDSEVEYDDDDDDDDDSD